MSRERSKENAIGLSLTFWEHFKITMYLTPGKSGLLMDVFFNNIKHDNYFVPPVSLLFPINGHLSYLDSTTAGETLIKLIGPVHIIEVEGSNESMAHDLKIDPSQSKSMVLFCRIPLDHAEKMKEIADKNGVVNVRVDLFFPLRYNPQKIIGVDIYNLHAVFEFQVPKNIVDSWLSEWTSFYAEVVGLPRTVPREIFSDYTEAVKCYNIGAYRHQL